MTWEQTIEKIRTNPDYKELVEKAYLEIDLPLNVERFRKSEEFLETIRFFNENAPNAERLLDIGSGNGISAVSFALEGYEVITVEPDPSDTVGAGAIRKLKAHYELTKLTVYESFAEEMEFPSENFDIVYSRQCMHHAFDLNRFVSEAHRVLKKNGVFITVRDHVIYNDEDKALFLNTHPLHKFYYGENAFKVDEYIGAFRKVNFRFLKSLRHFDSPINYFPQTKSEIDRINNTYKDLIDDLANKKLKVFQGIPMLKKIISELYKNKIKHPLDESKIPGRLISFIARK
jgi:ubiquinone/menaquinone biosynthesis C-methylase UbiE